MPKGQWITVSEKRTEKFFATEMTNYIFTKSAKIDVKGESANIAIEDVRAESPVYNHTLVLNNEITVKGGLTGTAFGIMSAMVYSADPTPDTALTVRAVNAVKMTVSGYQAAGILFSHRHQESSTTVYDGTLIVGLAGESFKQAITATASDTGSDPVYAYGIYSGNDLSVNALLAAPVTVKATGRSGQAGAVGFYAMHDLDFGAGIAANVSATASGMSASAMCISSYHDLAIRGDVAGLVTASATATGTDKSTDNAIAYGIFSAYDMEITGKLTKKLSVTASAKSKEGEAYGIQSRDFTVAMGGVSADIAVTASGTYANAYGIFGGYDNDDIRAVAIKGDVAGAITVKATGISDYAGAYGISAQSEATIAVDGTIRKSVSTTAEAKYQSASAMSIGFDDTSVNVALNDVAAELKSTAKGKSAYAQAIYGGNVAIKGDVAGKFTASATSTAGVATAVSLDSWNAVSVDGKITKALSATATGAGDKAKAYAIRSENGTVTLGRGIDADLSATATGKGSADVAAAAVYGKKNTGAGTKEDPTVYAVEIQGDISGKITATATAKDGAASAYGICSNDTEKIEGDIIIDGTLTKAITVKATGTKGDVFAAGICAGYHVQYAKHYGDITIGGIAADISVTANGGTTSKSEFAYGIYADRNLTIHGDVAGNITASQSRMFMIDQDVACAQCIFVGNNLVIDGSITKTLTVKNGSALQAATTTIREGLGTVVASGENIGATAWSAGDLTVTSGRLTGKATVTATGQVCSGLEFDTLKDGEGNDNVEATLDITAKSKSCQYIVGLLVNDGAIFTLKDSKITASGNGYAYAVRCSSDDTNDITLINTTLTGTVELGSKEDTDALTVHSGSLIKGEIRGVEELTFKVCDAATAKKVMWESAINQGQVAAGSIVIDVNRAIGETGTYALIRDTDGTGWHEDEYEFKLYLDGVDTTKTLWVGHTLEDVDTHYTYTLEESKDRKTLSLVIEAKDDDDHTINEAQTDIVSLVGTDDYLFTAKGKVTTKDEIYAIYDLRDDESGGFNRTVILNNEISATNKLNGGDVCGIYSKRVYDADPGTNLALTVRAAEKATKLTVTGDSASLDTHFAYGINFEHKKSGTDVYYGTLYIGETGEAFRKSISVTMNSRNGAAFVYGICSSYGLVFKSLLAAPVTVKATGKKYESTAEGIYSTSDMTLQAGIAADVSATATGESATAYGFHSQADILFYNDIAGKITATATANGNGESATAHGIVADDVTVSGKITKAITVKANATGNNNANSFGIHTSSTLTLKNGISADISSTLSGSSGDAYVLSSLGNITITGDLNGKLTATATGTSAQTEDISAACTIYSKKDIVINGRINKAITAKSTASKSCAAVSTVNAEGNCTIGGIYADMTATASGLNAQAYVFNVASTLTVNGDIAGKITASASGNGGYGGDTCAIGGKNIIVTGKVTKAITVKTTDKGGNVEANGISATETVTLGGIAADITATASGGGTVTGAYAIRGNQNADTVSAVSIKGDVAGKLTATASATAGKAKAYGIYAQGDEDASIKGDIVIGGDITKAITVKATSKTGTANAYGIYTEYGSVTLGGITADIAVTASIGSASGISDAGGIQANEGNVTIHGDVAGNITVTTNDVSTFGAHGINASGDLTIDGSITKSITVKNVCEGMGVSANNVTIREGLGTLTVTGSAVLGWEIEKTLKVTGGYLTGKATVTGSMMAIGLQVGQILDGDGNADVVATLDITAKSDTAAVGIQLNDAATLTLKDSKITASSKGKSVSLVSQNKAQNVTLDKSTLTGNVELGKDDDTLILTNKSKVTGDVDMGNDTDTVKIHSGSQIKGAISNAENIWLVLDDASSAKTALWEGNIDQSAFGETLRLDISMAAIGVGEYTLMKDTDGGDWTDTKIALYLDGTDTGATLTYMGTSPETLSAYDYELKSDKSGKSLILAVTQRGS